MIAAIAQIDVQAAIATANKFARKIAGRFDVEIESAANFAVAVALDKWTGEGKFETLLHHCVMHECKAYLRDENRRRQHETNFTDLDG